MRPLLYMFADFSRLAASLLLLAGCVASPDSPVKRFLVVAFGLAAIMQILAFVFLVMGK